MWTSINDGLYTMVKLDHLFVQPVIQRLKLVATMRGVRRQRQRRELRLPVSIPEGVTAPYALAERNRLQRILNARAHPNPLMPMEQQRSEISQLNRGKPDRRKPILPQQHEQEARIAPIMFLSTSLGLPNRCWMANLAANPQLLH
jgi:hypothetical protein